MKTAEILVIGGGVIGLAIAVELQLRGAQVTVLSRSFAEAAGHAAAGMLAPQAEGIVPGAMLDLCLRSRTVYPDWAEKLENLTGLETGFWNCGILAPLYDAITQTAQAGAGGIATWLDQGAIQNQQPGLSSEVIGGWWFPQDGQVDNQALMRSLLAAAQSLGVKIQPGVTVHQIHTEQDQITHLQTSDGAWQAQHYVLATGAWSQDLLPIPVVPRKGQMLSVRVPDQQPLHQVLFGSEIYIVPRRTGRIVIGATSEDVGFLPHNTPAGIQALLARAIRLYPVLQDFAIEEFWWGFRPTTPDEDPILGTSPYGNLTLATGHYRNGILLTPITALMIADWVWDQQADPLLQHFHYSRFNGDKPAQSSGQGVASRS